MKLLSNEKYIPYYSPECCLNRRQRKFVCTACVDACPKKVFSLDPKEKNSWDVCIGCGRCVTVCPTRSFAPSPELQRRFAEERDLRNPIRFACRQEEELCDIQVRCLNAVPWELIAACALCTDVVLYTGQCEGCQYQEDVQMLLEKLRDFLGEERFGKRVHLLKQGQLPWEERPTEEKSLSRREIFSGLKKTAEKQAWKQISKRLPFQEETEQDGMQYRKLLARVAERERKENPDLRVGLSLPRFTADCRGCRICEKLCPRKAIEIGPEENGQRLIWIAPWKCTDCSLCVKICPWGGISGMHKVLVPGMTRLPLVRITSAENISEK